MARTAPVPSTTTMAPWLTPYFSPSLVERLDQRLLRLLLER